MLSYNANQLAESNTLLDLLAKFDRETLLEEWEERLSSGEKENLLKLAQEVSKQLAVSNLPDTYLEALSRMVSAIEEADSIEKKVPTESDQLEQRFRDFLGRDPTQRDFQVTGILDIFQKKLSLEDQNFYKKVSRDRGEVANALCRLEVLVKRDGELKFVAVSEAKFSQESLYAKVSSLHYIYEELLIEIRSEQKGDLGKYQCFLCKQIKVRYDFPSRCTFSPNPGGKVELSDRQARVQR